MKTIKFGSYSVPVPEGADLFTIAKEIFAKHLRVSVVDAYERVPNPNPLFAGTMIDRHVTAIRRRGIGG